MKPITSMTVGRIKEAPQVIRSQENGWNRRYCRYIFTVIGFSISGLLTSCHYQPSEDELKTTITEKCIELSDSLFEGYVNNRGRMKIGKMGGDFVGNFHAYAMKEFQKSHSEVYDLWKREAKLCDGWGNELLFEIMDKQSNAEGKEKLPEGLNRVYIWSRGANGMDDNRSGDDIVGSTIAGLLKNRQ